MTRVKICGITNTPDALVAAQAGADLLGFVFYPPSPRCVTPEGVTPIARAVREQHPRIMLVGVFVDEAPDYVAQIAEACGLDCVQLHGDEPAEAVDLLIAGGLGVIKGFRVKDTAVFAQMAMYRSSYYLLDAYIPGSPGGTGEAFDWRIARSVAGTTPILLAGGLTPGNVAQAVRVGVPWGVDVSSGVEGMPGRKDAGKVQRFIAAAKRTPGKAEE